MGFAYAGGLMRLLPSIAATFFALVAVGCAPSIGDSCGGSADCALDGSRICDQAQPGGYCTVRGCDPDGCPGSSLCVEWRFDPPRTAQSWCMKSCNTDTGCRQSNGYRCVAVDDPALVSVIDGDAIARLIDNDVDPGARFCSALRLPEVGDHCDEDGDCSFDGSLVCADALPGMESGDRGYCTVKDCSADSCPVDSFCVTWRDDSTSDLEGDTNFCMKACGASIGCRTAEGYRCVDEADPGLISDADGMALAAVVPNPSANPPVDASSTFCAIAELPDGGVPMVDAGTDAGVDAGTP